MCKSLLFMVFLQILLFIGCKRNSQNPKIHENIKLINVQRPLEDKFLTSSDYFDSINIVPLETTEKSLIAAINRIIVYNDNIYILDRKSNSVLVFNISGSFTFSIKTIGRGPGEYMQVGDFCVDLDNEKIVVYAHDPMKLLYYDFNGNFLAEEGLEDIFSNIMAVDGKIIMFDINDNKGKYAWVKSYNSNLLNGSHEIPEHVLKFQNQRTGYPMVCKSKQPYFFSPLDYNIYLCSKNGISPKYRLDFGKNNIDPRFLLSIKDNEVARLFQHCREKEYGFYISNFRETDDYVMFKFEPGMIVLYSKKSESAEVFTSHNEDMAALGMGMYFAHDGNDNNMISIVEAHHLLTQFERAGWNLEPYRKRFSHFQKVENVLKSISETSNPILVFYSFISHN